VLNFCFSFRALGTPLGPWYSHNKRMLRAGLVSIVLLLCESESAVRVSRSQQQSCIEQASGLCDRSTFCKAFGLYGNKIQLHSCSNSTVQNNDWTIYAQKLGATSDGAAHHTYTKLPGHVNIDEDHCPVRC
jgi:hypothetical protein